MVDSTTASLRIVQVVPTLDVAYGGPSRNAYELFRALNARPRERTSTLLVMRRSRGATVLDDAVHREDRPGGAIGGLAGALPVLARADVVVVHGVYFWWTLPIALVCLLRRVPWAITPHGSLGARQRKYSRTKKAVFHGLGADAALAGARAVVVGSEAERADVAQAYPRLRVRVGGVGVPLPGTPPDPRPPSTPPALLSICRLHPKKRLDVGIRAVAALRDRGIACTYRVAGDGDRRLLTELTELAETLGVDDAVTFVGQAIGASKQQLYDTSDVFLVPSVEENFGIALAEALSMGLPAVATAGVAAAAVMDDRCGRVVPAPEPDLVATAVGDLLACEDFPAMRRRAHETAHAHFAWAPVADRWVEVLTDPGPPPTR